MPMVASDSAGVSVGFTTEPSEPFVGSSVGGLLSGLPPDPPDVFVVVLSTGGSVGVVVSPPVPPPEPLLAPLPFPLFDPPPQGEIEICTSIVTVTIWLLV